MSIDTSTRATSRRSAWHFGQDHGSNQADGKGERRDSQMLIWHTERCCEQQLRSELPLGRALPRPRTMAKVALAAITADEVADLAV